MRLLAEHAPVMLWHSGPDGLRDWFNAPWLEFTGRTMEQELGNGWAGAIHPDDVDNSLAMQRAAFNGRQSFRVEYRLLRHDGVHRWILDSGRPYERDGAIAGYFGSCVDISEGREAQLGLAAELAEQQALVREVHHRARNTLQTVLALLALHQRRAVPTCRRPFELMIGRVQALATVQQHLHPAVRPGTIEFADFLRSVGVDLARLCGNHDGQVVVEGQGVALPVTETLHLALAVSEALLLLAETAGGGSRLLRIAVAAQEHLARICIALHAGARGFSDEPAGSLPFSLLKSYARSVRGTVDFSQSADRTEVVLTLPLAPE